MTLEEYTRKVTHREHLLWVAHLREEWNRPTKLDHYLMSLIANVVRGWAKNPERVNPSQYRMKFSFGGSAGRRRGGGLSAEELAAASKAVWIGAVGGNVREVTATAEEVDSTSALDRLRGTVKKAE